ncbi:MAG: DUF1934 domain-containing protein [Clostridia bacterium]|nr:DUF1934 domain-containing protein [Clostridia bacterium]
MEGFKIEVITTFLIDGQSDSMQGECPAQYEYTPERAVVRYDEYTEDGSVPTEVVASGGKVDILRRGMMDLHLAVGSTVHDGYETGYGEIDIAYTAERVDISLTERGGTLDLLYRMDLGGVESKNHVKITVERRRVSGQRG